MASISIIFLQSGYMEGIKNDSKTMCVTSKHKCIDRKKTQFFLGPLNLQSAYLTTIIYTFKP